MPVKAFSDELEQFLVLAKSSTYAADLAPGEPSRPTSHDRRFEQGRFSYIDSSVGGRDFLGQEIAYLFDEPVWAMNYHGTIIDPVFEPEEIGRIVQASLLALYSEGRFLGGFEFELDGCRYVDVNEGTVDEFRGLETIEHDGRRVYSLEYHGGLIRT